VRVFSRRGVDKDERAMAIERSEIERLAKDRDDEKAIQERSFLNRLREKLLGRKAAGGFKGIKAGTPIDETLLAEHPRGAWRHIGVQDDAVMAEIETLKREYDAAVARLPSDWKYVAWVDADVNFTNPHWVRVTVQQLQHYATGSASDRKAIMQRQHRTT